MKIILNKCFGGFGVNDDILERLDLENYYDLEKDRTNEKLIRLIEAGVDVDTRFSHLVVFNIPDDATDYIINDYDGYETLIYVMNGKIERA